MLPRIPLALSGAVLITVIATALLLSNPAYAQHSGDFGQSANPANNGAYFVSNDYTLTSDIVGYDVFVGKTDTDNPATNFQTYTPTTPITFTIDGGMVSGNGTLPLYPDGSLYMGINVFGNNSLIDRSGSSTDNLYDTATLFSPIGSGNIASYGSSVANIEGGSTGYARIDEHSTANLTGGQVSSIDGYGDSTINLLGGSFYSAYAKEGSVFNIRDGNKYYALNTIYIYDHSLINFYGSDFSAVYKGSFGAYDEFNVNGILQDGTAFNHLTIAIYNDSSYLEYDQIRQVTFNTVVITESSTVSLLLAAGSAIAGFIALRRRNYTRWLGNLLRALALAAQDQPL